MVAREFRTGRTLKLWSDELAQRKEAPFRIGGDALFVAYFASAELSCFLALAWGMPVRILDLFTEFRCLTNGQQTVAGNGLLGALAHFGLDAIDAAEKSELRELATRGGPFTEAERAALLYYCESDVLALAKLLPAMAGHIDLPRALLRGRYMAAVARMERCGVPIDRETLDLFRAHWDAIKGRLIESIDAAYGVFIPAASPCIKPKSRWPATAGRFSFSSKRFAEWLARNGVPWPRLTSGKIALDDATFRQMSRMFPQIAPLRELRHSLGELRLFTDLAVGTDDRNRCLLSPFSSVTSRNQPSNAKFIYGPSCWLRGLIKPELGRALAYVDWSQQEFGIAAALSGDRAMQEAYLSGDPYLTFAKQAGAVPAKATKQSHSQERDQFKVCALAVQYGMGPDSLAQLLGQSSALARELLRLHRATYPTFWNWSEAAVDHAMLRGWLHTTFGWRVHVGPKANPRSLANFPMQANGAEMMRLACCLATEAGINVCCPIHDALLVEGRADEIEVVVDRTQAAMREASRIVLDGFELRSDSEIVTWPGRYLDPRGRQMWETVTAFVAEMSQAG